MKLSMDSRDPSGASGTRAAHRRRRGPCRRSRRAQQRHGLRHLRIPVGAYDSKRLANIGIGHGAADLCGGYTLLSKKIGTEVSAVAGFTFNVTNPTTHYKNGVDLHLDWAVSQFLSKTFHLGAVGYFYFSGTRTFAATTSSGQRTASPASPSLPC